MGPVPLSDASTSPEADEEANGGAALRASAAAAGSPCCACPQIAERWDADRGALGLASAGLSEWPAAEIARVGPASIQRLDLGWNRLQSIPPAALAALSNLRYLLLHENLLDSLPEEIGKLTRLEVLSLANNRLASLPASIGHLAGLTRLALQGNRLNSLPVGIGRMARLADFCCTPNPLSELPTWANPFKDVPPSERFASEAILEYVRAAAIAQDREAALERELSPICPAPRVEPAEALAAAAEFSSRMRIKAELHATQRSLREEAAARAAAEKEAKEARLESRRLLSALDQAQAELTIATSLGRAPGREEGEGAGAAALAEALRAEEERARRAAAEAAGLRAELRAAREAADEERRAAAEAAAAAERLRAELAAERAGSRLRVDEPHMRALSGAALDELAPRLLEALERAVPLARDAHRREAAAAALTAAGPSGGGERAPPPPPRPAGPPADGPWRWAASLADGLRDLLSCAQSRARGAMRSDDGKRWDLFVSYAREDREAVLRCARALERSGVSLWIDRDMAPGRGWRLDIGLAMGQCRAVAPFLSPAYLASHEADDELKFAHWNLRPRPPKFPVWLVPPGSVALSPSQAAMLDGVTDGVPCQEPEAAARTLAAALRKVLYP